MVKPFGVARGIKQKWRKFSNVIKNLIFLAYFTRGHPHVLPQKSWPNIANIYPNMYTNIYDVLSSLILPKLQFIFKNEIFSLLYTELISFIYLQIALLNSASKKTFFYKMQFSGCMMQDKWQKMQDAGCMMEDPGCMMEDAWFRMHDSGVVILRIKYSQLHEMMFKYISKFPFAPPPHSWIFDQKCEVI